MFENRRQFRHFENYLTGLLVLPNKSMANIARCTVESSDKTNLSRYFSTDRWEQEEINVRRVKYVLQQTKPVRLAKERSALILDDTLCEHVGSLFEYIDHHYNHGDNTYPLAHNPITSHYVSGPVRFPLDLRLYRRYEEVTRWEEFVHKHFPEREIPVNKKERAQFHKAVDPVLLADPAFQALQQQFQTKIDLAKELVGSAIGHKLPFSVVLFDSWYLAEDFVACLRRRRKDWISLLKKNRKLETNSFVLKDAQGKRIPLEGPHIKVGDLVPLIPANAYRAVKVGAQTYWTFSLTVRIPDLDKVRLVISFENAALTGTYAVLVTNRVDWTAQRILVTYLQRWPIETFYQDGKEHLGFDEYRMRDAKAIQKHWCLVFVAYSRLHLDGLPTSLRQSRLPIKTIGEACRQQAQALIEALILYASKQLAHGQKADELFAFLFAKQQALASA
ncbi:MAG TPA: transposase [Anaerolineales bacterium]|nr:transposase [Anaerolineales bacterium]